MRTRQGIAQFAIICLCLRIVTLQNAKVHQLQANTYTNSHT
jgi:hypothetical protein